MKLYRDLKVTQKTSWIMTPKIRQAWNEDQAFLTGSVEVDETYHGMFRKMSTKHSHRYVNEFAGRHNIREADTIEQMAFLAQGVAEKRLPYKESVA